MMYHPSYTVLIQMIFTFIQGKAEEYCEHETLHAECGPGQVITVQQALYGRMKRSRCISEEHLGCEIDVRATFDLWCSGRPACSVDISNLLKEVPEACGRDYRSFVDVAYTCVEVYYPVSMCTSLTHLRVTNEPILLSSHVVFDKKCGSYENPFVLNTEPGRQINITMLDYTVDGVQDVNAPYCSVYSTLSENDGVGTKTVCGGAARLSHVITTLTNQVEVRFVSADEEDKQPMFLLSVQAIGCATPKHTPNTIFTRYGNEADISCQGQGDRRYRVRCENERWIGRMANCSKANTDKVILATASSHIDFLKEYSIWTITVVALFVGCCVLVTGVVCIKRRSPPRRSDIPVDTDKEQYWPPPPPEALRAQYDPYRSHDNLDSQSNAYFRTWQLQRPHADNGNIPIENPPPYLDSEVENNTMSRFIDHIYESPKFERGQNNYKSRNVSESSSGYFEVDQRVIPQSNSLAAISRTH